MQAASSNAVLAIKKRIFAFALYITPAIETPRLFKEINKLIIQATLGYLDDFFTLEASPKN